MGYAVVAGLPPETGLYATIVPLLAYAVFGPSRILVLGPDSSLAPIIAASILPLALGRRRAARSRSRVCSRSWSGVILLLGGILRLGFVTDLLSKPIRVGYLNAVALLVIISQVPKLLGFSIDATSPAAGRRGHRPGHRRRARCSRSPSRSASGSLVVIFVLRLAALPGAGRARRGRARHGDHGDLRAVRFAARRRRAAAGPPRPRARRARVGGCRRARAARRRHRARGLHRQRRALAHLRRAPRRERRRQPGDGGHRPREHRGRVPRRVPGVGFVVAHARRRAGRLAHAAHRRRRRRAADRLHPARARGSRRSSRRRRSPPSSSAAAISLIDVRGFRGSCAWTRSTRRSHSRHSSACSSSACSRASS